MYTYTLYIIQCVAGLASSTSLKPGPRLVEGLQGGLFANRGWSDNTKTQKHKNTPPLPIHKQNCPPKQQRPQISSDYLLLHINHLPRILTFYIIKIFIIIAMTISSNIQYFYEADNKCAEVQRVVWTWVRSISSGVETMASRAMLVTGHQLWQYFID